MGVESKSRRTYVSYILPKDLRAGKVMEKLSATCFIAKEEMESNSREKLIETMPRRVHAVAATTAEEVHIVLNLSFTNKSFYLLCRG